MSEISILAIDLAKGSFQVCAVRADGVVVFNKSVSRPKLYQLLAEQDAASLRWKHVPRRITGGVWSNHMGMRLGGSRPPM